MRVNIQFSVDLEDVPEHIIRALNDAGRVVDELGKASVVATAKDMIENNNFVDSIKTISDYRNILLDLDHRLDDCMRIIVGYQQFIANPQVPDPTSPDLRTPPDDKIIDTLSDHGGFE